MAAMDYAKEITSLKALIQKEADSRRILEDWINSSLKSTLEKHQAELKRLSVAYESKILALESQLEKEVATRKKLTIWVKDNLGPNLDAEPFRDAVGAISARRVRSSSHSEHSSSGAPKPRKVLPTAKTSVKASPSTSESLDGYVSPWSDESDGESSSSQASANPRVKQVAPSYVAVPLSALQIAVPNPPLKSRVQRLASLELTQWGEDEVTDSTFPPGDAVLKTNKNRMEYYLHQQKQASLNYSSPTLLDRASSFVQKGGRIVFAPLHQVDVARDSFNFSILTNDRIFPTCPDGLLRSQVLYLVLQGLKRKLGVSTGVELPHGARRGFDPFVLTDHATDIQSQYIHLTAPTQGKEITAFQTAFGVDKVPRFGQDMSGQHSLVLPPAGSKSASSIVAQEVAKHRRRMREYFDLYYYGCFKSANSNSGAAPSVLSTPIINYATGGGRIIFMAFGSAVPVLIDRLTEVNYRFDLSKVTLLALPFPTDRLAASDTKPEDYINAYKQYASLFTPILEASPSE